MDSAELTADSLFNRPSTLAKSGVEVSDAAVAEVDAGAILIGKRLGVIAGVVGAGGWDALLEGSNWPELGTGVMLARGVTGGGLLIRAVKVFS